MCQQPPGGTPKGFVHFGSFRLDSLCESPSLLRVVGVSFSRSHRLYEGNRFLSSNKREMME